MRRCDAARRPSPLQAPDDRWSGVETIDDASTERPRRRTQQRPQRTAPADGASYEERRRACEDVPPVVTPRPRSGPAAALPAGLAALRGGHAAARPQHAWIGLAIAAVIYVAFYTSLFSNLPGLLTGIFGSVGYWLAQQRRGRAAASPGTTTC